MKLIVHDLGPEGALALAAKTEGIFSLFDARPPARPCLGCFRCWTETPGICVIADRARDFAPRLARATELWVISRLVFGGLAPEVKAILDRSIGYILPFFRIEAGLTRHVPRYGASLSLAYYFLAEDATAPERELARQLARANGRNLGAREAKVVFFPRWEELLARWDEL
ncbi:MAG: flavodoxin family protein [Deltaproteobacteria bacterium]|jgi:hypothetical protein|nr:flavodoxin family protein [Deltaproteobacteria bacterium]